MTTLLNPERVMKALDVPTDHLGMRHNPETRAALFAAIDAPGGANWERARSIVCNERGETLHALIIRLNGEWYRHAEISSYTILDALERSNA